MSNQLALATSSFKSNAKTFSLAARFLNRERYEAVARLYAFCRHLDDLADNALAGSNEKILFGIRQDILNNEAKDLLVQDLLLLKQDHEIPTELLLDFIDAIIADQYPREIASVDDLVRFSYGVASTVGLMMCYIFGVRNPNAFPFAIDLGVAMQISNICRDILEDAQRDRIYIPRELLNAPITCRGIVDGDLEVRAIAYEAAQKLLLIADKYYASAAVGYGYLPRSVRHTIKIAARLYQAIGDKVKASPDTYWRARSIVSRQTKISLIVRLYWQRMHEGSSTRLVDKVPHCDDLHRPLRKQSVSA